MAARLPIVKRVATILVVALLVTTAGCAGFLGGDPATNTTTTTTPPTTVDTTTDEPPTDTTTSPSTSTTGDEGERTVAATGEMAVVINDTRLDLLAAADTNASAAFWFDEATASGEWHRTDADVTVAEALDTVGVTATNDSLTYEGTTYGAEGSNTSLAIRVNGEPVNPTEYELEAGDEIWVVAITHPLNQSVPGTHIDHDSLHVHGDIDMTIAGDSVDFTRDRYQNPSHQAYFHFEGGEAHWHAHSWSVSLAYAMDTLPGINVTADSVTYNGTTYHRSDAGTSITITVNGEPVDPSSYILKDGDRINITVTTSGMASLPQPGSTAVRDES